MIGLLVLIFVVVLSAYGGYLVAREPVSAKRVVSLVAAAVSIASVASFIRLIQVYNSRDLALVTATGNFMAGLGPWDLIALGLSLVAIVLSSLGSKRARIPLLVSAIVMFLQTCFVLSLWD